MNQPQFVIQDVAAVAPARLGLQFGDGFAAVVDLTEAIIKHPSLARLADPSVFRAVAPDEWNRGVIFADDDDLTLASDNLRAMAVEQAGEHSHQQVVAWMHHHGLSLDAAAEALGISRRMLAYYRSGERPIPKTVGLAMLGWEALESGQTLDAYDKVA
ncbi:helix-turn-helix transcriptional regulator [Stenotrophomonas geniculata]|uniref:helix-turn-helix domain-containing protein n=1 Tax=Stenotrophomonas geniculata TaxID=86188 RepID=UPI001F22132C|nr:helix-turn-helix transcriptional regulator [Stenotrophomonas geniculata]MCF3475964.1 DUF2442 domain-containing protein [Stenotrophomonas maltophilia]MCI1091727.1 helix-turn-helix domain-containing protein [Stenotrophomonas maltophilia]MCI1128235.1 helix-turn-helix domain-containing protein [Stenotrophomonas maltophilia]MDC7801747.1 helix-turn-helix transcriptional regulator [Stenotrophomonas geniculata]